MSSARTISTSGISGAGLKKCMPTTRSGRVVAAAISVTESAEVFVARIASGAADPVELGEELPLRAELLDDRLDHEVAVGQVAELGREREPRRRASSRAPCSSWPFSTLRVRKWPIRSRAPSPSSCGHLAADRVDAGLDAELRDPGAHRAEPDDADAADLAAHSRSITAAIAWPKPMHMHATP